jgi:hypothetical protein
VLLVWVLFFCLVVVVCGCLALLLLGGLLGTVVFAVLRLKAVKDKLVISRNFLRFLRCRVL